MGLDMYALKIKRPREDELANVDVNESGSWMIQLLSRDLFGEPVLPDDAMEQLLKDENFGNVHDLVPFLKKSRTTVTRLDVKKVKAAFDIPEDGCIHGSCFGGGSYSYIFGWHEEEKVPEENEPDKYNAEECIAPPKKKYCSKEVTFTEDELGAYTIVTEEDVLVAKCSEADYWRKEYGLEEDIYEAQKKKAVLSEAVAILVENDKALLDALISTETAVEDAADVLAEAIKREMPKPGEETSFSGLPALDKEGIKGKPLFSCFSTTACEQLRKMKKRQMAEAVNMLRRFGPDYYTTMPEDIENCGYYIMSEEMLNMTDLCDEAAECGEDSALFYHEWY